MSFLDRLFNPGEPFEPPPVRPELQRTTCPFCLAETLIGGDKPQCQGCKKDLPPLYLAARPALRPVPIQVFGLPRHGKTVFLAMLSALLERLNTVWPACGNTAVTEASQRLLREVNGYLHTRRMPPFTPLGRDECYVMLTTKMERWGSRALLLRDCSGEAFQRLEVSLDEARFLVKAPLVFMFAGLHDFYQSEANYSLDMLLVNYLNTLLVHRAPLAGRKVIVVLTKGDLLLHVLPAPLFEYLQQDVLSPALLRETPASLLDGEKLACYLAIMDKAGRAIERWLAESAVGRTFINLARDNGIEVRYCLITSTGVQPDPATNVLPVAWQPSRVLDPLFWALELEHVPRRSPG